MMNCTGVRKFLYAFADGQLGVKANCEVLDHLKMCPACSRLVSEHQALRAAVGRMLASIKTPEALRARIVHQAGIGATGPATTAKMGWRRPMALAASLALIAFAAWQFAPQRNGEAKPGGPVRIQGGTSVAMMIADVHQMCLAEPAKHQAAELPIDRTQVASSINRHFNNRVAAVAPDLSRFGYKFESVNYCGIDARLSREGGHLVYASHDKQIRLSLFCVPRMDRLDQRLDGGPPSSDGYSQFEVDVPHGKKLSILAWHRNSTSYAFCGTLPLDQLREMVSGIRLAMPTLENQIQFTLQYVAAQSQPGPQSGGQF